MRWAVKFGAFFASARTDQHKEKKKINKRKKGDRKTAPPYIFSSPKVEEKISVEAGVRARVRKKAYLFAFLCFRIIIKGFYAF